MPDRLQPRRQLRSSAHDLDGRARASNRSGAAHVGRFLHRPLGSQHAEWERIQALGRLGVSLQIAPVRLGTLKVVTTNLRAGYLRRNGVPYSENAVVTEYFDRVTEFGNDYLIVHTTVDDSRYLNQPFITSTHFKREPDDSKFSPSPCE